MKSGAASGSTHFRRAAVTIVGVAILLGAAAVGTLILRSSSTPKNALDVWISPRASVGEARSIERLVKSIPSVTSCTYWSQAKDYKQAKRLLPSSESLVLNAGNVPASYRCDIPASANVLRFIQKIEKAKGVYEVTNEPLVDVPRL